MQQQKPLKETKSRIFSKMMMLIIFFTGLLVMTYPFYSNAINNYIDWYKLEQVQNENSIMSHALVEKSKKTMQERNKELAVNGLVPSADPFNDPVGKKITGDNYAKKHLIGAVSIPAIQMTIPLFDLTNDQLLQLGATVLQGTSYPIGGLNTHAVISAHSGLPERKLFTDLEEIQKGDIFVLTVFNEKLAYQVERIQVVKPNDTSVLKIEANRDLVTLLTCTPYMINSHRLLVTGQRIAYSEEIDEQVVAADHKRKVQDGLLLLSLLLAGFLFLLGIYQFIRRYLFKKADYDT